MNMKEPGFMRPECTPRGYPKLPQSLEEGYANTYTHTFKSSYPVLFLLRDNRGVRPGPINPASDHFSISRVLTPWSLGSWLRLCYLALSLSLIPHRFLPPDSQCSFKP